MHIGPMPWCQKGFASREGVMGSVIAGSGMSVPANVVTNHDLERIMDTTDDWIISRTGVKERRFVDPGIGASDLAVEAASNAMADAGAEPGDIDLLITATMTPDYVAPGISGLVQAGLGLGPIPAIDIRQQCSGFLYGLDLADTYLAAGRALTAIVVGTEVHGGFLPWSEQSWQSVLDERAPRISEEDYARNTAHRSWSVLFGDGAGAVVLRAVPDEEVGILASSLHTDGGAFELIWVPGVGFRERPYVSSKTIIEEGHLPVMDGGGLYRQAVQLMPRAVEAVFDATGYEIDEVDLVVAHQANDRILEGVRRRLGIDDSKVPSNIGGYGNTTSATLPILYDELRRAGRVPPGSLICFTAFGAGSHYGSLLYREPG
jgi:3-oxoacyl-[acyl-carrier-protein] synthase-3